MAAPKTEPVAAATAAKDDPVVLLVHDPFINAVTVKPFNGLRGLGENPAALRRFVLAPAEEPLADLKKELEEDELVFQMTVKGMSTKVYFFKKDGMVRDANVSFTGANIEAGRAWIEAYVGAAPWQFVKKDTVNGKPLRVYAAKVANHTLMEWKPPPLTGSWGTSP